MIGANHCFTPFVEIQGADVHGVLRTYIYVRMALEVHSGLRAPCRVTPDKRVINATTRKTWRDARVTYRLLHELFTTPRPVPLVSTSRLELFFFSPLYIVSASLLHESVAESTKVFENRHVLCRQQR
ncbi:hypothetical protein CPSG_00850 [Coccidioides posadasii str. Silveira]|uniref:Uncharacterized protein n=1 Tax=Coccidioides posadasii (strain RMSCC 757 / Silveira) TaxID=443226 RepID=E9CTF9_COCPS|nr:hypothetical protein CPSG_00850 [Coccidioides posadasii str. Silveira]